jgi:hypothetical protein
MTVLVSKQAELLHTAKRLVHDEIREHVTRGLPVRPKCLEEPARPMLSALERCKVGARIYSWAELAFRYRWGKVHSMNLTYGTHNVYATQPTASTNLSYGPSNWFNCALSIT